VAVGVGERLLHRIAEPLDQVGVGHGQRLRGEVERHAQLRVDVGVGADLLPALGQGGGQERLDTNIASTRPASSAAAMSGKASSTKDTLDGSPPSFLTISLVVVSTMLLSVLVATFLPSSSFGLVMAGSLTTRPPKSLPCRRSSCCRC
jgi:hypothetical protein